MTSPNESVSPPSESPYSGDFDTDVVWYGNIQYLINISAIGALCCLFVFLFVKLRSDHRKIPGPSGLFSKLLSVWHFTVREIARHCGADAAQFLILEGGFFSILIGIAILSVSILLPLNLYGGNVPMDDQFSKTTVNHVPKGSPLLWVHFIFTIVLMASVHFGVSKIEQRLRITRFTEGHRSPSNPTATAIFTVMVQGIPKSLGFDISPLRDYFEHRYPGKLIRVVVPMDLSALDDLVAELVKVRGDISWLVARMDSSLLSNESECEEHYDFVSSKGMWKKTRDLLRWLKSNTGFTDEKRLKRLRELKDALEIELAAYKDGRAPGAGVAFVMFKDAYSANKAIRDFENEKSRRTGKFFSVVELQLGRNQWRVEQAPLATDIYWSHLGSTKLSLKVRRIFVNTCLLLLLLFFSSPLAVITAMKSAGRIIDAEAMNNAETWLAWFQTSSWFTMLLFQFLPNVIIFVSMYIIIPSALSYISKFERHYTVSGEQRAALVKMVCFFLVNLIVLRALVESSLESTILSMGRCYLDGEDCRRIQQYMSASFLSRSCLSSLAFLITSTFLGISYDLLAPVPWIKKKLQMFQKNDMLHLVPERNEEYSLENHDSNRLRQSLIVPDDIHGQDLSVYPINGVSPVPKQTFDFAQYYAFNLTIFALTIIYSSFTPLVVPVGAVYFGYRYVVDKYNFLFVYRVRGFAAGNDGRMIDTVLCVTRFCVDLYLLFMLLFFSVYGDSTKLQAILMLGLLVIYKLLPSNGHGLEPALLEGMQTYESDVDGPIDYEIFSKPRFEWDTCQV